MKVQEYVLHRYVIAFLIGIVVASCSEDALAQPLVIPAQDETALKQVSPRRPTVAELKQILYKTKSEASYIDLGEAYAARKDFANAMACYKQAVLAPDKWDRHNDRLVCDVEEVVSRRPLDPNEHIILAQAFRKYGEPEQAELEYRQAIQLSPHHTNPKAEKLLAELVTDQIKKPYTAEDDAAHSLFIEILNDQWHPPSHEGFALTRVYLYIYDSGRIKDLKVMVSSGSEAHDRLAKELVKNARFDLFRGKFGSIGGRYDFACASRIGKHTVSYVPWNQGARGPEPDPCAKE
jgi:tetratricopeptide (TPR) repeat protein